jgi:two-component system LytT family response regulator
MNPSTAPSPLKPIRAILVDDEPLLREHLRERLEAHPEIDLVGEAHGVDSAAELVAAEKPDVIFLDVRMPPETGFDLLPRLEGLVPRPVVVFVTAYDRYALKAFDANAFDYLTKPVHPARLAKTISRLKQAMAGQRLIANLGDPAASSDAKGAGDSLDAMDLIPLQDGAYIRMVEVGQIAAAEIQGDYTRIFAAGGRAVMIKSTLSLWENKLPPSLFCKISRRLLINRKQVNRIAPVNRENTQVFLNGIEESLLLSRIEIRRLKGVL